MPIRILVATNDPSSDLLERLLSGCGFELRFVSSSDDISKSIETFLPDVILVSQPTITLEEGTLTTLSELCERGKISLIATAPLTSKEGKQFDLNGPYVRRLANPLSSHELLNAIFETTCIGAKGETAFCRAHMPPHAKSGVAAAP